MKNICRRFLIVFIAIIVCAGVASATTLIPGGQVIGLTVSDDTVTVAGFHQELGTAAKKAGLMTGDRIVAVAGKAVKSPEDLRSALKCAKGAVEVSVLRKGKPLKFQLCPTATAEGPKLGIFLRQGVSGLGTVTFYREDGSFGALGHGVGGNGGTLIVCKEGKVYPAGVYGVKKGVVGKPGQLLGQLTQEVSVGQVVKNTNQGVFGSMRPKKDAPMEVGQAKTGGAVIRSTVCDEGLQEYSVEILKVYPGSSDRTRNLLLKVTDKALLETTGGIVQGMGVSYNKDNQWNP